MISPPSVLSSRRRKSTMFHPKVALGDIVPNFRFSNGLAICSGALGRLSHVVCVGVGASLVLLENKR